MRWLMHPGSAGGHSHDATPILSGCADVVPLPEGAEPPTVQVKAEPGSDVGEIEVGVVLENFELTLDRYRKGSSRRSLASLR